MDLPMFSDKLSLDSIILSYLNDRFITAHPSTHQLCISLTSEFITKSQFCWSG
jgi:hypothetical protein